MMTHCKAKSSHKEIKQRNIAHKPRVEKKMELKNAQYATDRKRGRQIKKNEINRK